VQLLHFFSGEQLQAMWNPVLKDSSKLTLNATRSNIFAGGRVTYVNRG
jgi:hypothetical protein